MEKVLKIFILLIVISPAFALGEGNRNLLLIAVMGLTPLFLFYKPAFMPKIDIALLFLCLCMMIFPLLFHYETMRWSTVLYSCMFCLFFMTYARLLNHSSFTIEMYSRLLKNLIYAFCIALILQQICVLFNLPIINKSNYSLLEPWKLNSLTSEPSHTARLVAILMYSLLWMEDKIAGEKVEFTQSYKNHKKVWLAFFWVMVTSISGTAILMILVVVLKYFKRQQIIQGCISLIIFVFILSFVQFKPVQRVYKITEAALTFNKREMMKVDHSASLRLIPMMVCFEKLDLTTLNGWTGHGVDYTSKIMYKNVSGVREGYTSGGYGIIALEYGFIPFMIITSFTLGICYHKKNKLQSVILWFFCCFFLGINIQIAWAFIFLSYTNKQFDNDTYLH